MRGRLKLPLILFLNALALLRIQRRWREANDVARFKIGLVLNTSTRRIGIKTSAVKTGGARFAVNVLGTRLDDLTLLGRASIRRR